MATYNAYEYGQLAQYARNHKEDFFYLNRVDIARLINRDESTPFEPCNSNIKYLSDTYPDLAWIGASPKRTATAPKLSATKQASAILARSILHIGEELGLELEYMQELGQLSHKDQLQTDAFDKENL